MLPVRCMSCNKPISRLWDSYCKLLQSGLSIKEALDKLNLMRYCCRRMFITHVEMPEFVI